MPAHPFCCQSESVLLVTLYAQCSPPCFTASVSLTASLFLRFPGNQELCHCWAGIYIWWLSFAWWVSQMAQACIRIIGNAFSLSNLTAAAGSPFMFCYHPSLAIVTLHVTADITDLISCLSIINTTGHSCSFPC